MVDVYNLVLLSCRHDVQHRQRASAGDLLSLEVIGPWRVGLDPFSHLTGCNTPHHHRNRSLFAIRLVGMVAALSSGPIKAIPGACLGGSRLGMEMRLGVFAHSPEFLVHPSALPSRNDHGLYRVRSSPKREVGPSHSRCRSRQECPRQCHACLPFQQCVDEAGFR